MLNTEIDLATLDVDAIRLLIRQGREILRNRRLIPDASLRKADTPALSDADRTAIRRAARRFGLTPVTLADEMIALRNQPRLVTLRSRTGDHVRLTPLLRVHWTTTSGTALTGNGLLYLDLCPASRYATAQVAAGEYVVLESDGTPNVSESTYYQRSPYQFERVLGPGFVRAWEQLREQPTSTAFHIILAMAGHEDSPQEALLTWCVGVVAHGLVTAVKEGRLIDALLGHPLQPLTLADLLRPALAQVRAGAPPRTLVGQSYQQEWHHQLVRAVELFLVCINLITPDLETDPVLEVPLRTVWERYKEQERLATVRAGRLRAAVVERFGFQETTFHGEKAWIRVEPRLPPGGAGYEIERHITQHPHVLMTESCRIYINGRYRCVVEARAADLPHADQVVRRLLAVATRHRERIHTLTDDLLILEEIFREYKDARIWDLVRDHPPSHSTYH